MAEAKLTKLMYETCASEKNLEKAKTVIDYYVNMTNWLNVPFQDGNTPMMVAALNKNYEIVNYILSIKGNVLHRNNEKKTLLDILEAQEGLTGDDLEWHTKLVTDVKRIEKVFNSGQEFHQRVIDAFLQQRENRFDLLDAFLACGFNIDRPTVSGTLMLVQCMDGRFSDVIKLVQMGANLDKVVLNHDKISASVKPMVDMTAKKIAYYHIRNGKHVSEAVTFLEFLDTLEGQKAAECQKALEPQKAIVPFYDEMLVAKKTLANGDIFAGSFKNEKPFEGALIKTDGSVIAVRSDDGETFVLVFPMKPSESLNTLVSSETMTGPLKIIGNVKITGSMKPSEPVKPAEAVEIESAPSTKINEICTTNVALSEVSTLKPSSD